MRGQDFLTVAESLAAAPGAAPESLRTAMSRAYYAAFLELREALRPFQGAVHLDGYGSHKRVRDLINNCGVELCKDIHDQLAALHRQREDADYNLQRAMRLDTVRFGIRAAAEIVAYAGTLAVLPRRRALRDGLYGYLQRTQQLGGHYPGG